MEKENKERLLDAPEVYERLRDEVNKTKMNQTELANKIGLTRPYLVKLINGKAAISGSAIKAFIAGDLDVQYIFTGQSDREALKKKDHQIQILEDLLKKAYQGE